MTDTEQKRIKEICKVAHIDDISDLSDGYHTFKQLYYQRMMLFATIVKQNKDKAWKSLRHEDGELCFDGGWFIVGIDTPEGSYTYHYEDKYFSLFDCEELERGKTWDGHIEKDVTRLLSLEQEPSGDAIDRKLVCAFIAGLISDDREREKGLEYIRHMPPVTPQPCTDAISRQAIKRLLENRFMELQKRHDDKRYETNYCLNTILELPPVTPQMMDQWQELKETIIEMRDNDGTGTQQEACKFLANLMDVLENQMSGSEIPKTGRWIHNKCDKCGASRPPLFDNYCSNCGAKMIEPQESEDKR